jgi:hypothetical protein
VTDFSGHSSLPTKENPNPIFRLSDALS